MDTYKLKFTPLEQDLFSLLCVKVQEKLSQREIAKMLHVSPTAVASSVKRLKEKKLVKVERTKTINFISFNRENQKAIELKRVENLRSIYYSSLSDYLFEELPGCIIILFGSYSRGEDISTSDIDLAVIEKKDKKLDLGPYEKILSRRINVNFYPSFQSIHKHLKNNILNGIVLQGSIEI